MNNYSNFLETKRLSDVPTGKLISDLHSDLYDFQRDITKWALRRGRAAVFADCGLGKTHIQLGWARHIDGKVLIVAPLSVGKQTANIAEGMGIKTNIARSGQNLREGINITNYEMLKHFDSGDLNGIVLDESSIIKHVDSKTRQMLMDRFSRISWRLCCTATPCPNDITELANHAEFLGIMTRKEMLSTFFINRQDSQSGWTLKGHAQEGFYKWLVSWAMALKSPADLGYAGDGFILPELKIQDEKVSTDWRQEGELFPGIRMGLRDHLKVRKNSVQERAERIVEIVKKVQGQVIIWCALNEEAKLVARLTGGNEIKGADSIQKKTDTIMDFVNGTFRILVTKPKIAGFGLNLQNANNVIFCGLGYSYESYYQCIRRCWRYGQKKPVNIFIVTTDHENGVVDVVRRKERESELLSAQIVEASKEFEMEELGKTEIHREKPKESFTCGTGWGLYHGDCVEIMEDLLEENSVDFSIFSPPFASLYTYTALTNDIGNSRDQATFFEHFGYAIKGILKVLKPGRLIAVHVAQIPAMQTYDGWIGLKDFRGRVVSEFVDRGWIYHGELTIDKNPQVQAIRTHAKGLLFSQLKKDSSWLRPGLADYLLIFRKDGENQIPIKPDVTNEEWIQYAHPVWYGIRETNVLNVRPGRDNKDERHICPLQLDLIDRAIRLWSNPGDVVFSPFAGIGSEGVTALKCGRQFVGIELKTSYAHTAVKNLLYVEDDRKRGTLDL